MKACPGLSPPGIASSCWLPSARGLQLAQSFEEALLRMIEPTGGPNASRFGWSEDDLRDLLDEVEEMQD